MVTINGRERHVMGYLQDFLFPPKRVLSPVSSLSGGERNRLLLARLFTQPANLLVLDEPTNDLDVETLELLEELLTEYKGTLLLVSHDRTFLDNVVTSTLVFEGDGRVNDYVGGYTDWLRQRKQTLSARSTVGNRAGNRAGNKTITRPVKGSDANSDPVDKVKPRKLGYKEQRELEELPARIEALENEQTDLQSSIGGSDFYQGEKDTLCQAIEGFIDAETGFDAKEIRKHALQFNLNQFQYRISMFLQEYLKKSDAEKI